jgi:mannose-6-phosphate isomerase-like protein (cupin superfamily)
MAYPQLSLMRSLEMVIRSIHKLRSDATDGHLAIIENTVPSRYLVAPLHRHAREDEVSIVLSGKMGALLGDEVVAAGPGSYVMKPRGQWHAIWNAGDEDLRIIELIVPGGFEECVERLAPMLNAPVGRSHEAMAKIAAEYGIEFDFDGVQRLCERFNLKPW